jgi:hypothetical protein
MTNEKTQNLALSPIGGEGKGEGYLKLVIHL